MDETCCRSSCENPTLTSLLGYDQCCFAFIYFVYHANRMYGVAVQVKQIPDDLEIFVEYYRVNDEELAPIPSPSDGDATKAVHHALLCCV